jgi:PAS domain S-box-containing protein
MPLSANTECYCKAVDFKNVTPLKNWTINCVLPSSGDNPFRPIRAAPGGKIIIFDSLLEKRERNVMRMFSLSQTERYGGASIGVVIAAALRMALDPLLGEELPLFIFAFPVIFAAWFGGLWPGLLATALSLTLGDYLFIAPRGSLLQYNDLLTLNRLSFLLFFGLVMSILAAQLRGSIKREIDSMERSRLLIEGVDDYAILMLDSQGRVISWNSGAERITGYKEHEIMGRDVSVFFTPEDIEGGMPQRGLDVATAEGRCEEEGRRVRKDGSRYWANVITTALRGEAGQLRGFAKVTHDITRRKEAEEERERLLSQEKAAREEAEVAGRLKDEFLSTLSHELRTPLTSILGWARLGASGSIPERQTRQAMEVIAEKASAQSRLIDDILDMSQIVTGRLRLDVQPVEVESVFQAVVDIMRPGAELKRVNLNLVVDAKGEVVLGDATRLRQAIWNLLSNAVKFSNEGGRIEARLARAGNQIEITVSDTGIGIDPQFMPHVFEQFRQADGALTRKHGGLGLGLAIAHRIVEMHGGDISASSPGKNQGATFKIRLPLISTASTSRTPGAISDGLQEKGQKASEKLQRLDGLRILIVEDNPDTVETLRSIFNERGAEVITAASASEAMDALERNRPDALVSDIATLRQDGYELIQHVRERGPDQGGATPAIAITAGASAEDRLRALSSGFQMHIAKPIDPEEMIAVVASLVGRIHS